jgi:hypothetical protein
MDFMKKKNFLFSSSSSIVSDEEKEEDEEKIKEDELSIELCDRWRDLYAIEIKYSTVIDSLNEEDIFKIDCVLCLKLVDQSIAYSCQFCKKEFCKKCYILKNHTNKCKERRGDIRKY